MDDRFVDLLADIARQAVRDYRAGFRRQGIMSAEKWLRLAGLLNEDGALCYDKPGRRYVVSVRPPADKREEST